MRYTFFFLLVVVIGCKNSPTDKSGDSTLLGNQTNPREVDSIAAVSVVREFFKAFDEKDLKTIDSLLNPSMKIIHHNGAITNTAEMIRVIEETKDWWPRTRRLSNYEFTSNGNLSIVSLKNEVTFSLPNNKKVYEPYNETWIFEKKDNKWRPIRCHYSKITVDKHSEEVK